MINQNGGMTMVNGTPMTAAQATTSTNFTQN